MNTLAAFPSALFFGMLQRGKSSSSFKYHSFMARFWFFNFSTSSGFDSSLSASLTYHLKNRSSVHHSTTRSNICTHATMSLQITRRTTNIKLLHLSDNSRSFMGHHALLLCDFILHPSHIPGDKILSKSYAMCVLPVVVLVVRNNSLAHWATRPGRLRRKK